jgi:hypothetical protein
VNSRLPDLDLALLTAAVDQWRLKTHTFHLRYCEMTITSEDVTLIFRLLLDGPMISGIHDTKTWIDLVE